MCSPAHCNPRVLFPGPQAAKVAKEAKVAKTKKSKAVKAKKAKEAKVAKAKKGKGAAFKAMAATVDENKMALTAVASVGVLAVAAALFTLKRRRLVVGKSAAVKAVETTPMLV